MTFRKVTPAALKVNVKKFWQVLLVPWHVWAPIWVHFAPWWSIFPVKNRFSHIFPAPEGSPYHSLFLRYEIEKGSESGLQSTQYSCSAQYSVLFTSWNSQQWQHSSTDDWRPKIVHFLTNPLHVFVFPQILLFVCCKGRLPEELN